MRLTLGRLCCLAALLLPVFAWADPVVDFFRSVEVDDAASVKALLAGAVGPNQVDPRSGETGLILALREGSMRVFAVLMATPGVDLEASAPNSNTALMMAAFKHNRVAVDALLARKAQVNRAGWNALHYAAAAGDADITRLLLAHGAQVDALAPARMSALMLAAREGQEEAVAALLAGGANAALKNVEGLNAADIALRADKPHIAATIAAHHFPEPPAK
ncbi:MAG: ankyrin repeat domain-containing protein [Pseudomonadota bacterium]